MPTYNTYMSDITRASQYALSLNTTTTSNTPCQYLPFQYHHTLPMSPHLLNTPPINTITHFRLTFPFSVLQSLALFPCLSLALLFFLSLPSSLFPLPFPLPIHQALRMADRCYEEGGHNPPTLTHGSPRRTVVYILAQVQ